MSGGTAAIRAPSRSSTPRATSGKCAGNAASSSATSTATSHWIARRSCGIAAAICASSASSWAWYAGSTIARSPGSTNTVNGASGVGSETWKRTVGGITPARASRAKTSYEPIAAAA